MRIGIVGDIHFCEYSSILRTHGEKFSTRLENCLDSINWAEQITQHHGCDRVFYLGDFFDKPSLNSRELTAVSEIKWNNIPHSFLVGNHEMGINDLSFSSAHILKEFSRDIIDKPAKVNCGTFELCYLPYILESDRQNSIHDYFGDTHQKRIILSHNDISGMQLGKFISKDGFSIEDIESNCDLFINGHLHNGSKVTDKIINVGNLTGQNFSEDGFIYDHVILILDTDTLKCEVYKNPFAINFYKLSALEDLSKVESGVVTIKTTEELAASARLELEKNPNVLASRVVVDYTHDYSNDVISNTLSVDHLEEFRKFVLAELGDSTLIQEELSIINV